MTDSPKPCGQYGDFGVSWLRDSEQIPLLEEGGIEGFFRREVLPHVPDAWIGDSRTKIGYEISFNRYFYEPEPLRPLAETQAGGSRVFRSGDDDEVRDL
jgi:type I restriction enzyme M protein